LLEKNEGPMQRTFPSQKKWDFPEREMTSKEGINSLGVEAGRKKKKGGGGKTSGRGKRSLLEIYPLEKSSPERRELQAGKKRQINSQFPDAERGREGSLYGFDKRGVDKNAQADVVQEKKRKKGQPEREERPRKGKKRTGGKKSLSADTNLKERFLNPTLTGEKMKTAKGKGS